MLQNDIDDILLHDVAVTRSIDELHENGEDVIRLDSKTFPHVIDENNLVFIDFYASR